ncbi:alpha/beta hydrolase [Leifsonia shinshuensis]|uniref:alpha/beta hydrolase n=1 Tax=Leifsonia shinshuensis TaxID=150026 RepID=UPI00285543DC|nr:alpha/beta hydrolase [Leifsonia shinshuensis]MDR6971581.1 pimeloyl-ACP methyl ester carboxylesterase [Leifsonia shinshuensis]
MTDEQSTGMTVVLVHGAFADAGSWAAVTQLLQAEGVHVLAPAVPLRGLLSDAAYLRHMLTQLDGTFLLVGHSYGGAVITNAATGVDAVKGLVFVSGFAPEEGQTLGEVEGTSRDSALAPALVQRTYPTGDGDATAVELYVNEADFPRVFAGDLSPEQGAVLGSAQRPVAAAAFDEKNGAPAWKNLPSWAVVATGDKAAGSDVLLGMAKQAGAQLTTLEGSHLIMISQPRAVADVILGAIQSVSR